MVSDQSKQEYIHVHTIESCYCGVTQAYPNYSHLQLGQEHYKMADWFHNQY